MSEKKYAAQEKYDRENTVRIVLKLNKKTDADIIQLLQGAESKQGLIKTLLKQEIAASESSEYTNTLR